MTPREMIEWIQTNVGEFCMTRCRDRPNLVYVASPIDVAQMRSETAIAVRGMSCDGGFNLHTAAGYVEVIGDPSSPRGGVVRMFRCRCGQLFGDDSSRSGKCAGCMMTSVANSIAEKPATFTTTCARCAAPLEATDAAHKAHEEMCFAPITVSAAEMAKAAAFIEDVTKRCDRLILEQQLAMERMMLKPMPFLPVKFDEPDDHIEIRMRAWMAPIKLTYGMLYVDPDPVPPPDPLDVTYDGVSLQRLICRDQLMQQSDCHGTGVSPWPPLTPAQRAAVSAHWSAQLRERVAASKERERLSVMAPDLELETANCKDAT